MVRVSAQYMPSGISVFDSIEVEAARGYIAWTPDELYLLGRDSKALTLVLTYDDDNGTAISVPGGSVNVVRANITVALPPPDLASDSGFRRTISIVIGVVVGVMGTFLVVFAACCFWRRGKNKIIIDRIRRRSSQGYGVGQSRTQRVDTTKNGVNIQLDESPTSPRTAGQNVFREEVRRQEWERA